MKISPTCTASEGLHPALHRGFYVYRATSMTGAALLAERIDRDPGPARETFLC